MHAKPYEAKVALILRRLTSYFLDAKEARKSKER